MDEQTKQIVGITVGIGVAVGIGVVGCHYYLKSKTGFGIEKLPKLLKSRWQNIDSEYEEIDDYKNDRPVLSKLKDAVVNKLYPQDYAKLPRTEQELIEDMERFRRTQSRNRGRFTVFDSNKVSERFKILETVGDPKAIRGTKRLRVSGNIYRKDTPSGYNKNNRNVNFADLGIF